MKFNIICVSVIIIIGALVIGPRDTSAQQSSLGTECNPKLFQELDTGKRSLEETLATIEQVDESNFRELKKDASGNVTIPVKGVPVNFGATYESFETLRVCPQTLCSIA